MKSAEPLLIFPEDAISGGDILLCVTGDDDSATLRLRQKIGPYTHAAIALGDGLVAEAGCDGVAILPAAELIGDCPRIAVLKGWLWDNQSVGLLTGFVTKLVDHGTKFDTRGMLSVLKERQKHVDTAMQELHSYIDAGSPAIIHFKSSYFCSELVVTAFAECGLIGPEAEQIIKPRVYTPPALALDRLFGSFCGYILNDTAVPDDDLFLK